MPRRTWTIDGNNAIGISSSGIDNKVTLLRPRVNSLNKTHPINENLPDPGDETLEHHNNILVDVAAEVNIVNVYFVTSDNNPVSPLETDQQVPETSNPVSEVSQDQQVSESNQREYNEIADPSSENPQGGINVDEAYKRLIDRLDQDIRDHRKEIAARDAQLRNEMREREERIMKALEETLTKQKEILASQKEILELKFGAIEKEINNIKKELSDFHTDVKEDIRFLRGEMINLTGRVDQVHGRIDTLTYFVIGSLVSAILAFVGIIVEILK